MESYSEPPVYGDVSALTCESCGRHPALRVTVRRHVGLFYLQRFVTVKAVACRACGRRLVRNFTLRTLAQGWWGAISFFFNWFVLGANAVAWLRLGRLNEPSISGTNGLAAEPGLAFATWGGAGGDDGTKKKRSWLVKGGAVGGVLCVGLVLLGIGSWGWDATHHDHSDPHGQPMTAFGVKRELAGKMFVTEGGARAWVESADCTAASGKAALDVHFKCRLSFNNGDMDDVVVHILRDELFFRSSRAGGA